MLCGTIRLLKRKYEIVHSEFILIFLCVFKNIKRIWIFLDAVEREFSVRWEPPELCLA